ncbi:PilZ domain-containing protein [Phytopseudomonas dryadis]|uniref:Pilus assembly protein PilZ n=1 Tax=Phytopseudomonas dryadis TaxID=2487520 RepID=A0A4Q9QZB3_9GAMM|nr:MULTISPECIES: PilZ domain-containing protein [Pseudomonas]TBU89709.1 pilus assembly protein PilZ [Pseudomonas dryadis]TBV06020.1 pilus assembly protein PilZ [Pseudomonas dryadis]TBV18161.1 pilus assembly protein PilZ [Pseudomonas sp. FRB 230]
MHANRHIERHQLPYYLNVFNLITDKPMGHLGNVSLDGLMLISQLPMLVGGCFDMRLKIPGADAVRHIDFTATCLWCREDVTPGSFDSGFSLIAPPAEYVEMVEALRHYFSFHPLLTSA